MTALTQTIERSRAVHQQEQLEYQGATSESVPNSQLQPAFYDMETGRTYLSVYADGRTAPIHILDGLPTDVQWRADINIISGFVLENRFLTREQAMKIILKTV